LTRSLLHLRDPLLHLTREVRHLPDHSLHGHELTAMVHQVSAAGQRVVVYAASAKGNVRMNYCRFGPAQLEYIIDATPVKQGLYSPGVRIPIKSPEHFRADRPDYALLLAWNHKDEILAKEQAYRAAGGKFIVPIPKVHLAQ